MSTKENIKNQIKYIGISIPLALVVGAIDAIFGRVLLLITDFRSDHPFYLIPFLFVAGLFTTFVYKKYGKGTNRGMGLIFDAAEGKEKSIPFRLVPLIVINTWLTHLFGGSAGREGVAVQIGATVYHRFGKYIKAKDAKRILLISGLAAGFGGLFQTPLAATAFALEVIVIGEIYWKALPPAIISAFIACKTSSLLGLEKFSVALDLSMDISFSIILKMVLLGVIFGLVGFCFSSLLKFSKSETNKIFKNQYIKAVVISVVVSAISLVLFKGRYSGLGTNLISLSTSNGEIYWFDFVLKLLLTIVTLSAGFQGGEVTPLFSIGASLGFVIAPLLGLPTKLCAALGYAAVFGAASNTLIAPMLIGIEVFGISSLPYMIIVCAFAYAINFNKSIYPQIKKDIAI